MAKGDLVVAIKDLGGLMRERVPKGSRGRVTEETWTGRPTKVVFTVSGMMGDRKVEISVDAGEVE